MSSFKGSDYFGSGPHTFTEAAAGQDIVPRLRLGFVQSGSISIGPAQLAVTITGRLVAATDEDLWALIADIKTALADWETPGALIDGNSHEWPSINFVRFETTTPFDRGRAVSVAYTALFVEME